jgi:hypothetical protein
MKPDNFYLAFAAVAVPFLTALLVAVVTWAMQLRKDRVSRHADRLLQQLEKLYGPLYFYTTENGDLAKTSYGMNEAHKALYEGDVQLAPPIVEKESERTLTIRDKFGDKLIKNNARIARVITKHWHLIIPADAARFQEFVREWNRYNLEHGLPSRVRDHMKADRVLLYSQPLTDLVATRFGQLYREWVSLSKSGKVEQFLRDIRLLPPHEY